MGEGMSRIEEGDCDDTESFLRGCAFEANGKRAIHGRKGQKILRELEEALLAMPEKRLIHGKFATTTIVAGPEGLPTVDSDVCALGCLAVHREMKAGKTRAQAVMAVQNEVTSDEDDGGWEAITQAADYLDLVTPLAYAIVERNDEYGGTTPEKTYEKFLRWVQKNIHRGPGYWGQS
jgi:hypothetical protein